MPGLDGLLLFRAGSGLQSGMAAISGLMFCFNQQQGENGEKICFFVHYGFEKPTPEIMAGWGKWFESMKDHIIDMGGHFRGGREISKAGTKDLPLGLESITGFTIVSAGSLEDAEKMAQSNPFISSIRVYEVMSK